MGTLHDLPVDLEKKGKQMLEKVLRETDILFGDGMLDYLEVAEPENFKDAINTGRFDALWAAKKYEEFIVEVEAWAERIRAIALRVKKPIRNTQLSQIHIMQKELNLSDEAYRKVIQDVTGHDSCKDLLACQAWLVDNALRKLKRERRK